VPAGGAVTNLPPPSARGGGGRAPSPFVLSVPVDQQTLAASSSLAWASSHYTRGPDCVLTVYPCTLAASVPDCSPTVYQTLGGGSAPVVLGVPAVPAVPRDPYASQHSRGNSYSGNGNDAAVSDVKPLLGGGAP